MDAKLRVACGTHAGKEIKLAPKFLVGRDPDCQLRAGSDLISRHHCVLNTEDGRLTVRDLGSVNGTLVNGVKVSTETETQLRSGDLLQIGPLSFEIVIDHNLGGKKRPAVKGMADIAARTAQAPPAKCADDDITQWLGAPDPKPAAGRWAPAPQTGDADTQSVTDTVPLHAAMSDTIKASTSDTVKTSILPEVKKGQGKREFGKLPKSEVKAKDSCEAAAAVLKQLSKRR